MGSNPTVSASGKLPLPIRELHIGVVREFLCPRLYQVSILPAFHIENRTQLFWVRFLPIII